LILDQFLKFWIKLNYYYNESHKITDWFYLYFIENEGMAFGMTWGGESGKLMLSLFRLVAVVVIGLYLANLVRKNAHQGFIVSMALIFAGATGNIIDSVFYGEIFSMSTGTTKAILFPPDGGYASLLHGRVVDMLYFPLFEGFLPDWLPYWGGDYFIFFRPIFNIADASITSGVLSILIFQKTFFRVPDSQPADVPSRSPLESAPKESNTGESKP
jgi:signal peptidase II